MPIRVPRQVFDRQGFLSIGLEAGPGAISSASSQWSISSDSPLTVWDSFRRIVVVSGAKIVRVIVRELGTTAAETERKRLALLVDSLGWFRLVLFAVARNFRLLSRRSWVRSPPPLPKVFVFNLLGRCRLANWNTVSG